MKIDSHHHFWDFSVEEYGWIGEGMDVLKKDFGPGDLEPEIKQAGIDGVISVQARTDEKENDFLLTHAETNPFIRGVVGWLDLAKTDAADKVAAFSEKEKAVGLREVLQGMEDREYCLRDDFNRGLAALHSYGLAYDILIFGDQLKASAKMVDQHPGQRFVLDHIAKPVIGPEGVDAGWAADIRALAERENIACKVSGMVTEVVKGQSPSPELMRPWFDVVLDAFGPERIMFGSDWPVCLLRTSYADWVGCVDEWIAELSKDEQAAIKGETAQQWYQL